MLRLPPLKNDDASAGVLAYFGISVFAGLAIYMLLGPAFDLIFGLASDPGLLALAPVSEERINTLNIIKLAIAAVPFVAIFLPNAYYAIITSLRQEGGGI